MQLYAIQLDNGSEDTNILFSVLVRLDGPLMMSQLLQMALAGIASLNTM